MLTLAFNIQPAEAQTRKVGVKVGDWAKYEVTHNYTTNDSNYQPQFADIEYFKTEVLSVTGMNITFQTTTYFKNGTEMSKVMSMDISGGSIGGPPPWILFQAFLFVAANLTVGDTLRPDPSSYVINATLMRTYAGAQREVNFVCHRSTFSIIRLTPPPREEFISDSTTYMFWDKATGVLVETNQTKKITCIELDLNNHPLPGGYVYMTKIFTQMTMKETNIWSPMFIPAKVCINPKSLNVRSQGKWITAHVELPEGYSVSDIDRATILLNDTIPVDSFWVDRPLESVIGDYDNDGITDLMVKFDRQTLIEYLETKGTTDAGVTIAITGETNGKSFEVTDTIKVIGQ